MASASSLHAATLPRAALTLLSERVPLLDEPLRDIDLATRSPERSVGIASMIQCPIRKATQSFMRHAIARMAAS